jgi:hypothetical protein
MTDGPIPGKVRMIGGKEYRFIEHALEVDKWEAVASPIPAAPSDVAVLVERLRADVSKWPFTPEATETGPRVPVDMADDLRALIALIESLAHDREVMREALEPFAKAGKAIDANGFGVALFPSDRTAFEATWSEGGQQSRLTWGDFRRATLASLKGGA